MRKEVKDAPWFITDCGEVISKKTGKARKLFVNRDGYVTVTYSYRGKTRNFYVHRLVAEYFIEPIPKGMAVNHKDGDKTNNHVDNLEIVTYSENIRHADASGLRKCATGGRNSQAKLTDESAELLIFDLIGGITNDEAARKYNLHSRYVSLIRHKRRWKSLWERIERSTTIRKEYGQAAGSGRRSK
jgi:hypothetical protein